jgi:hypothetical protein
MVDAPGNPVSWNYLPNGTAGKSIVGWRSKSQRESKSMCGRFTLRTPTRAIVEAFSLEAVSKPQGIW